MLMNSTVGNLVNKKRVLAYISSMEIIQGRGDHNLACDSDYAAFNFSRGLYLFALW